MIPPADRREPRHQRESSPVAVAGYLVGFAVLAVVGVVLWIVL